MVVLQDPRHPSFLILPVIIAISGIASLLFLADSVNLSASASETYSGPSVASVLLEGESTSNPADGWNTYPTTVAGNLTGAIVTADGVNGVGIDYVNGEGSKAHLLTDGAALDVAVLWIGINDIAHANDPAVVYTQMVTWVAERRAEGWDRVILVTVTKFESAQSLSSSSWGSHELAEDARQMLNELIVLNQAGADSVVDLRDVEGIGDNYPLDDQVWRSDKVHFTQLGYERVGNEVLAAIGDLGL